MSYRASSTSRYGGVAVASPPRKPLYPGRTPLANTTNRSTPATKQTTTKQASSTVNNKETTSTASSSGVPVGTVGLLRHSQSSRGGSDTGNSPTRQRISTLSNPLARSTGNATTTTAAGRRTGAPLSPLGGGGGGLSNTSSITSSQRPNYTNMSLDSALMGGILAQKSNFLVPALVDVDNFAPSSPNVATPPKIGTPVHNNGSDKKETEDEVVVASSATTPPAERGAVTVVWDLDETLCCNRRPGKAILRPGAIDVLKHLRALSRDPEKNCFVEVILWTASMECVARPVLERLDPHGEIFNHLIFRDRRWYKESGYTKDLKLLGRDLSKVVIIENSPMSVYLNRKHSILVRDFMGTAANDKDLSFVKQVLDGWATANGQGSDGPEPCCIVEFLNKHPNISSSNEVIARTNVATTNAGYTNRFAGSASTMTPTVTGGSNYFPAARGGRGGAGAARSPPGARANMYARRY